MKNYFRNEIIEPIIHEPDFDDDIEILDDMEISDANEENETMTKLENVKRKLAYKEINELDTKENVESYRYINPTKLEEGEEPLGKVIGHENQKKELLSVIDWFNRSKELKAKGVSIPKGVILFGEPGNGKSLLIKEIIRCCNAPVFVFEGEQANVVEGIITTFKKAKEAGHAIVVFDELDLLINKERRVIRALQESLDGVESSDDILVLAATNYMNEIPDPLIRHGRLEKLIRVPRPTGEEALQLLKKHFKEVNLEFPKDFDDEEVSLALNGISCAGVKSVVNDLVLRNGFENSTVDMIDKSIYNVTDRRVKDTIEDDNLEVAIHEAGHCLMAKAYPKFFVINKLNISGASGEFHAKEVERYFWPFDKVVADIHVAMAGLIAQKVICGRGTRGAAEDLQRARVAAYNLLNISGYSSCWETLPQVGPGKRVETATKRRRMERKIERLLKKCERETTAYIKKHTEEIKKLGALLFEKKHLKSSEILACIG